jgi:hypothetical protein
MNDFAEDDRGGFIDLFVEIDRALQGRMRIRCRERHRECESAEEEGSPSHV